MIYIRNLPWNIQSYYFNETKTDLGWWNLSSYEILSSRPDNFSQRTKDCHQLNRYMLLNLDQYLESRSFWFFFFLKKASHGECANLVDRRAWEKTVQDFQHGLMRYSRWRNTHYKRDISKVLFHIYFPGKLQKTLGTQWFMIVIKTNL